MYRTKKMRFEKHYSMGGGAKGEVTKMNGSETHHFKTYSGGIPIEFRQAVRPPACEILTDILQILVPRLFVPPI